MDSHTALAGRPTSGPTRALVIAVVLMAVVGIGWWLRDSIVPFLEWVRSAGTPGMLAFVVAYVLACVLFVPGLLFTMAAGLVYGVALGAALAWIAATIGSTLAFALGRTIARDAIATRVADNARFAAIDRAVGQAGLKIVLLTRLSPVFPFNLLNYAYGLTSVSLRDYVIGAVGMIPGTFLYVYLGSLATSLEQLRSGGPESGTAGLILKLVGFLATVAVTITITRIARRALDEATADAAPNAERHTAASEEPAHGGGAIEPGDVHNQTLLSHVHPTAHVNPTPAGRYNLVVVGAGTAGLVAAAGAAGLGAKVALVERHLMGGDCLNVGCVPSKGLLSAAGIAATAREARAFGVHTGDVTVDFPAVMERMRRLRARLSPLDSVSRFRELGVDVYLGHGRFTSPTTLTVDGRTLDFSRALIATGARAVIIPIPGLAEAGPLTNETIFELTEMPHRLAVIGGGPIGCEMAQAFRRFGAEVTLLNDVGHVLPREDADAAAIVERRLEAEGVRLLNHSRITRVERRGDERLLHFDRDGRPHEVAADAVLVSVGRAPNLDGLGLEAAGVAYERRGVTVDDHLRTTNRRIYAAGDIASQYQFTHAADALARIVLRNALFFGRRKASALTIPWCTYTSPEIAHVGLHASEAAARGIEVETITVELDDVDRAVLAGETDGFLKVHVKRGSDRIVGATLVAAHAGDMIGEIAVAMAGSVGLGTIAETIHPYPTQAEIIKKAGDAYNRTRLTPTVKRLFERVLAWRR